MSDKIKLLIFSALSAGTSTLFFCWAIQPDGTPGQWIAGSTWTIWTIVFTRRFVLALLEKE